MKKAGGPSVSDLFANTSGRTHVNQSDLRVWMAENHDEFLANLQQAPRGWAAISVELTKAGFSKPDGSEIDGGYARRTWHRVRASFERIQAKPTNKPADEPRLPPIVRSFFRQAMSAPAMPDPPLASDEPEPDLSQIFKVMRRPKKVEE